jgi:hypothetical protein
MQRHITKELTPRHIDFSEAWSKFYITHNGDILNERRDTNWKWS